MINPALLEAAQGLVSSNPAYNILNGLPPFMPADRYGAPDWEKLGRLPSLPALGSNYFRGVAAAGGGNPLIGSRFPAVNKILFGTVPSVPTPARSSNFGFGMNKFNFEGGRKFASERGDLLRDTDNIFYGGGNAPAPTPTPTPSTSPRFMMSMYKPDWASQYGWGA